MKKLKIIFLSLVAILLVLGITACDTGSSSDDDDTEGPTPPGTGTDLPVTERSLTPLTVANLVGIWTYPEEESFTFDFPGDPTIDTENTKIVKIHFFDDSTYVEETIYKYTNVDDPDDIYCYYDYDKGTITIDGNNLTFTNAQYIYFDDSQQTDFGSAPWEDRHSPIRTIKPVFIHNGGLYTSVFTRITEGSGLLGTWQSVQHNPDYTQATYYLTEVSFDADGNHDYYYVANTTGVFEDFSTISNSTYEFTAENIFTYNDTENDFSGTYEVFLSGDLLALTGGYPRYCYTKETP